MLNFNEYFADAPRVRPQMNLGCLFDIPNGRYHRGKNGESILNGGLAHLTGIAGRGNTFKSVLAHFMNLRVLDRYIKTALQIYDTEATVTFERVYQLAQHLPNIAGLDLQDEGRLHLTDNTVMMGDEWFDKFRKFGDAKIKDAKKWTVNTPFLNPKTKEPIAIMIPTLSEVDSLSALITKSVDAIYDKNKIGEAGANTDALRSAAAKTQMLLQMPTLTGQASMFCTMTAHVGDQHQLDPYAPPAQKLAFLKQKSSLKNVPEKFTFLMNNLWYVLSAKPLQHKDTKAPLYPRDQSDNMEGDTDLMILLVQNLRAKNGPTGMPFEVIVSQSEGVLVGLTEYNYLKNFDKFGLGGNDVRFFLDIYPDVQLMRTTIRGKLEEDAQLRRAMEITSELCQMKNLWDERNLWEDEKDAMCTPKELYDDLKAKGYDWSRLLNTRGYWAFEGEDKDLPPYLSTKDLLRMRKGLYHPKWYGELKSAAEPPKAAA